MRHFALPILVERVRNTAFFEVFKSYEREETSKELLRRIASMVRLVILLHPFPPYSGLWAQPKLIQGVDEG